MTTKTTRTRAQGDASRRAILDAALRIAGERGYVGTTVALVSKASGLPASSLYWHFKDKDHLIADALDHGFARWHDFSPRWDRGHTGDTLADSLTTHFLEATSGLDQEPGFWRMGLMLALETGPAVGSEARDRFLRIRAQADTTVGDWWRQTGAAEEHVPLLVRLTMAALDGLFVAHQSEDPELLGRVVPMLANGIARVAGQLSDGTLVPGKGVRPARPSGRRLAVVDDASGRDKLLAAGEAVAAESGYEGATISRICARAGLPASSLYWHFKDKDDLFAAVVERSYQEWTVGQPAWLAPEAGVPWDEELRSHFATTLMSLQDEPSFLRIGHLLLLLHRAEPPSGRARFVSVRRRQQLIMSHWFRDALDLSADASDLFALLTMVLFDGLFFSGQLDVPSWDAVVMSQLLVGVLAGAVDAVSA